MFADISQIGLYPSCFLSGYPWFSQRYPPWAKAGRMGGPDGPCPGFLPVTGHLTPAFRSALAAGNGCPGAITSNGFCST